MKVLAETLLAIENDDLKGLKLLLTANPYLFHFDLPCNWPIFHRCLVRRCVDLDLVKLFIASGGDVNRRADGGVSLVYLAATVSGGAEILALLKANDGRMSSFEEGVLVMTTGQEDQVIELRIKELVAQEASLVLEADHRGFTMLHHAVHNFHFFIVPFLLAAGANPNAISNNGRTPLGLCALGTDESTACWELMVSKGAKYTEQEEIVEQISTGKAQQAIAIFESTPRLRNGWCYPHGSFLHVAALFGNDETVLDYLLNHGTNPNTPNQQGMTALHYVMDRPGDNHSESLRFIQILAAHGADVNYRDLRGFTPFHEAVSHTSAERVKLLVDLGADINAKTLDGRTPLDIVKDKRFSGSSALISWLKTKGARSGKK